MNPLSRARYEGTLARAEQMRRKLLAAYVCSPHAVDFRQDDLWMIADHWNAITPIRRDHHRTARTFQPAREA